MRSPASCACSRKDAKSTPGMTPSRIRTMPSTITVSTSSPIPQSTKPRNYLANLRAAIGDLMTGEEMQAIAHRGTDSVEAYDLYLVARSYYLTGNYGDPRRDEAIDRLKLAIKTAVDPDIRVKSDFIRERIRAGDQDVMVADYFTRGGSDFTRYQFLVGDPRTMPDRGLLLRTDANTTANWADTALMPPDSQLFHLDMIDPKPEGGDRVAIYAYFVGEPTYDVVRAKVMEILRGEAQPLSGEPGSLQGIMKRK